MGRVAEPLRRMGATIVGRSHGTRLPLASRGVRPLAPLAYTLPVASAQLKSAILLAGLWASGPVSVTEPAASRDHTERMLRAFGVRVLEDGLTTTLEPGPLRAAAITVPGDLSSAAFLLVAGLVVGDARVAVRRVGLNPTRTGVLDALGAMGAALDIARAEEGPGEPVGTVTVTTATLRGTTVAGELIPRLIDEVPVLAVAAACATGRTEIRDAGELRVKESDRIAALARQLARMGVAVEERADGLVIDGPARLRGGHVSSGGDHRIAMALAVAGLAADGETVVDDTACIMTSFPGFAEAVNTLAGGPAVTVEP
jgi:3-phosphoshikimate 1-carboxyvinyltransferase